MVYLYLKYFYLKAGEHQKAIFFSISVVVLFLALALETAFPKLISTGEGVVKGYHVLETNTGSKLQIFVEYGVYQAIGDYSGGSVPSKGSPVKVNHLKSFFLSRDIFIFYD